MELATIMTVSAFLFIISGLGYAALLLTRPRPIVDTIILSLAIGLGMLPIVILALRILHIPMDLRILIFLAAVAPAYGIISARGQPKNTPAVPVARYIAIGVVLIAAILVTTMMYVGATKYPYLEDDDPWSHAIGAHYVAIEKTTGQQDGSVSHYLEPYPPYFTATMGVLHQANPDLQWVLKFFNALIIGISIIGAFYAFDALLGDQVRAAAGAVILGAIPAYMSHFIWSQTLAIPVFLIATWAILSVEPAKRLRDLHKSNGLFLAILMVWSVTIIQPSSAAVAALLFTVLVAVHAAIAYKEERKLPLAHIVALVGGGILSLSTWIGFIARYGWTAVSEQIGFNVILTAAEDTSGGVVYSIRDIIFAPYSSKIDQATGIGWLTALLVIIAVVIMVVQWRKLLRPKNTGRLILLAWLIIGLIGIEGNALPFKLFPHRFWVFLAIPVALLAADAISLIASASRKRALGIGIVTVLVAAAVLTSMGPRLAVQQATWPPGVSWSGSDELAAYIEMEQQFPIQSSVISLCGDDNRLVGMNMHSMPWTAEAIAFKEEMGSMTGERIFAFMEANGYDYAVLDVRCVNRFGENATAQLGMSMSQTQRFVPVIQKPGIIVVRRIAG